MEQNFQLNQLRKVMLLAFVYNDNTMVFGPDFIARILECKIHRSNRRNQMSEHHVSRSYYSENSEKFTDRSYSGEELIVPEKNEESNLIKLIIDNRYKDVNQNITCQILAQKACICYGCKGKGFIDWVEEMIEVDQYANYRGQKNYQLIISSLSNSFYEINFNDEGNLKNISAFYRRRKLNSEYIKECKICPYCRGVGYDHSAIESFIPFPIVENLFTIVESYKAFTILPHQQLFHSTIIDEAPRYIHF